MDDGRGVGANRPAANQKAYVCICVFENAKSVKLVSRSDGDWQILCGDDHPNDADYFRVVGIGHEFDKDPTLLELIDLPPEWDAERSHVGGPWLRTPSSAQDASN